MRILEPNTGEEVVPIPTHAVYVYATDYKLKALLRQVKIANGQHSWHWLPLRENAELDISEAGDNRVCSFENAINRAINDAYATVYMFNSFDEMAANWDSIEYKTKIGTVYEESEE